jgi:hypothetical protein
MKAATLFWPAEAHFLMSRRRLFTKFPKNSNTTAGN